MVPIWIFGLPIPVLLVVLVLLKQHRKVKESKNFLFPQVRVNATSISQENKRQQQNLLKQPGIDLSKSYVVPSGLGGFLIVPRPE